jgi:nicotinate-nucleotide pyrophosphorylase (carboxylating)
MSGPLPADGPAPAPRHAVREVVARALAEDLGPLGDLTAALVPARATATVAVVARQPGVLAGTACATEVFAQLDKQVAVTWKFADGARLEPGQVVGTVTGPLRAVLTGERSALNFLCHLSGVATATRAFVDAAGAGDQGAARIWDTRKTLPGLRAVEKAAVRAGGGVSHRGSLSDFVLVKDNHLAGLSITDAVQRAQALWPGRVVEVECDRVEQLEEAIAAGATMVLLDNMTPAQVGECVELARAKAPAGFLVEVSGGVTLDTVRAYADAGADLISTGVVTQSAPALDLAFDLEVELTTDAGSEA